ncbi:phage head closure protein [Amorphus coralli]|uniref:phage head closure protein n=1 Tax=Amorphus coralli TaxID=340680 RepID=UPI0003742DEA|nr:phage head closure protein [Amorphus coralli]
MKAPAIGALDRRLAIEAPVRTADGAGGATVTWRPVASVWGRVESLAAAERDRSGRLDGIATHRITVRAHPEIAGGQRIVLGSRILTILATRPEGRGDHYLVLEAQEEGR